MQITTEDIVRSVTKTIDANVLPETPAGWPASYLRSAVLLLTYVEDRVRLAPGMLRQDNLELRELLEAGAVALEVGPDEDLAAINERHREALCELIKELYRTPEAERTPADQSLVDKIAGYRAVSIAREDELWRRAEGLALM